MKEKTLSMHGLKRLRNWLACAFDAQTLTGLRLNLLGGSRREIAAYLREIHPQEDR